MNATNPTVPALIATIAVRFVDELLDHNSTATPGEIGNIALERFSYSPKCALIATAATMYADAIRRGVNPARADYDLRHGYAV